MPISPLGGNATQFNPLNTADPAAYMLTPAPNAPSNFAAPSFNFNTPSQGATAPNYANIIAMLSQTPTSMTNTIMPYLQSLFTGQNSLAQQQFSREGSNLAAQAQSNAMQRGLTGSSIEQAGIMGAYDTANQGYNQFLLNALSKLGQSYLFTAGADVQTQNQMYQNLAQAMGQQMQSQISQNEFNQQLQAGLAAASLNANANIWAGGLGGLGNVLGGAMKFMQKG